MYVWRLARRAGGQVRLRIEDHDRDRSRPEFERSILDDLEWLGCLPDLPPISAFRAGPCEGRQSDHLERYDVALDHLIAAGRVYGCSCSRAEIFKRAEGALAHARGRLRPDGRRGRGLRPRRTLKNFATTASAARAGYRQVLASALACDSIPAWRRSTTGCWARNTKSQRRSAAICWCVIGSATGPISRRCRRRSRRRHQRRHPRPRPAGIHGSPDSIGASARANDAPDFSAPPVDPAPTARS